MTQDAVVFASYIPDDEALSCGEDFLHAFQERFSDCTIFIGINPSIPAWERSIRRSGLDVSVKIIDESLHSMSDASAYQGALSIMRESRDDFDIVWFCHTKGSTNRRSVGRRNFYIRDFLERRAAVTDLFHRYSQIGAYGKIGIKKSSNGRRWNRFPKDSHTIGSFDIMENFGPFLYPRVPWCYIETFYVLRGNVMKDFLETADDSFFTSKIKNRFFFEDWFHLIASRRGYFPYVEEKQGFKFRCNLNEITEKWIEKNRIPIDNYRQLLTL
jgi:hypothetical protein